VSQLLLTIKNTLIMKKSVLLITLGLILLTGCSKDDSAQQIEEQSSDYVFVLNQFEESSTWKTMEIDVIDNTFPYSTTPDTKGYGFTSGLYNPPNRNPLLITWNGTNDKSGYSGSAEIRMSTPSYSFHFIMETECVTVIDNVAMYGGLITHVVRVSGNPPPFGMNWRFYFKVIDNANGGPSSIDKISSMRIFASPRSTSLCNVYPPNHPIWSSQGYQEVHEPGFVVVKND
jgi:hypothetical protein